MPESKRIPADVESQLKREGLSSGEVLEQLDEGQPEGMNPFDREALVTRLGGESNTDIGKGFGVTKERIRQRLQRAFRKLRFAKSKPIK